MRKALGEIKGSVPVRVIVRPTPPRGQEQIHSNEVMSADEIHDYEVGENREILGRANEALRIVNEARDQAIANRDALAQRQADEERRRFEGYGSFLDELFSSSPTHSRSSSRSRSPSVSSQQFRRSRSRSPESQRTRRRRYSRSHSRSPSVSSQESRRSSVSSQRSRRSRSRSPEPQRTRRYSRSRSRSPSGSQGSRRSRS